VILNDRSKDVLSMVRPTILTGWLKYITFDVKQIAEKQINAVGIGLRMHRSN